MESFVINFCFVVDKGQEETLCDKAGSHGNAHWKRKTTQKKKKVLPITRLSVLHLELLLECLIPQGLQAAQCQFTPRLLPTLHHKDLPLDQTSEPFVLCFISGNISVCYGCWQKYPKPCVSPNDLCVRHKEWWEFFLQDQWQLRPDSAISTIIVMCHVFKQDAHFSLATCFKSLHLWLLNFSQFILNTWQHIRVAPCQYVMNNLHGTGFETTMLYWCSLSNFILR